ncbi:DUF2075 domain-containing protein [Cytophagales bacterium LB-30]|uniref:DUF2075 domain-containing protein n=1 Tax=Shiella aurantiaca TaxID=3058365 RepID=A0ABT8F3N4_9BACT|nr:DUF2075 domain-containing protein [Shiella aurantiaca]MDN4165067.1 DUF2075 domain-containing protein [Shiella aurantiaca]
MIIYQRTKEEFSKDILTNEIDKIIAKQIKAKTGKETSPNEIISFKNSLGFIDRVLNDKDIPDDCGISIEYHIPQTAKRIDFIISGSDGKNENVIIIELKQWSEARLTDRDGIVETRFQGGISATSHPSYQAWSYAALLQAFNATIDEEKIGLYPCAYLHNYEPDDVITNDFYAYYIEKAPVFLRPDAIKLRNFIKKVMKYGDKTNILGRIDNGRIRPTKSLADSLKSLIKGNQEFVLIDDQKVVYETALILTSQSNEKNKNVLIVQGGPGTGKSVVAINLLVELNRRGLMAQYVTKTSAPREVYFDKLRGEKKITELKNLFVGSGTFINAAKSSISALIVDEAHRLTKETGFLKMGDDQIKEIIQAAMFSIFFIDEDQRVHMDDYGEIYTIQEIAKKENANIHHMELTSQFRCNGSDGYLAWLDNTLQIRETANTEFISKEFEFDFKILKTPSELRDLIFEKNKLNNKARLVAGYCWDWNSDKNPNAYDIIFHEYNFQMKWNLKTYGSKWIIDPNSVNEVGCIHTCQGLEVDYVGVIIGDDLLVRNGEVLVQPNARSRMDKSIFGWKRMMKEDPATCKSVVKAIIKNTYRTLMTRGMKGCYVYFTDKETEQYFRSKIID